MTFKPRQQAFADLILTGCNQTDAYLKAGYKAKSRTVAEVCASRLLLNDKVASYITEMRSRASVNTGVTLERVLNELALIGFSDLRDFASWNAHSLTLIDADALEPEKRRVLKSVTVKADHIKLEREDKLRALELIGKHLGMWDAPQKGDGSELTAFLEALRRV